MDRQELIERLKGYEWNDVEFKRAQRNVPASAYETVSAFSNTEGGWLIFGVRDVAGGFEIVGVQEVDKVQNDFLSVLRSGQKLNRVIAVKERLIEEDGKALLAFHISEARRQDKPVYLGGDIRQSFIRRGAGDERCTEMQLERLLRDAADERYDGEPLDLAPEQCFDDDSLRWYRKRFDDRNPGRHDETLSHLEFLYHWGLVVEIGGRLLPTRASVLLFGVERAVRQMLPRPVVDWQWHRRDWSDALPVERWADRLVIETNLVETWKTLVDRYVLRAEKPFSINPETLRREDLPPEYVAFREAAINLLIHQDYADHTRKPVVEFFNDRMLLWNPGDAFVSADELLDPGEKEVRNPRIVAAFRRIGLSEQAGTGIRAIFGNWRRLGRVPPIIDNDRTRKAFQLTLLREDLLSEKRILFQAGLGVDLNEAEAKTFAFACRQGKLRPRDVRAVTGLSGADAQAVLDRLAAQRLISPLENAEAPVFEISTRLKGRPSRTDQANDRTATERSDLVSDQPRSRRENLSTAQVGSRPPRLVTDQVSPGPGLVTDQVPAPEYLDEAAWKVIMFCDVPRSLTDILVELGFTHRTFFRRAHLEPLLRSGVLRMTRPYKPNHPDQAYVLTEAGTALKARRLNERVAKTGRDRTNGG